MKKITFDFWIIASFALVGCLVVGILCWPSVPTIPTRPFDDAQKATVLIENPECAVTGKRSPSLFVSKKTKFECAKALEEHRLAVNDLIQQTRAADAATAQSDLAGQAAWLAFVQAMGGFVTLVAAGAAAFYARQAARAAEDTFDLAQTTSNHIDRPWLAIGLTVSDDLTVKNGETTFKVDASVENIGNRVATDVVTWVRIYQGTDVNLVENLASELAQLTNDMRSRAKADVRTVLPHRSLVTRAPQKLKLFAMSRVRAIAYTRYRLPSGDDAFSWEVFEYEVVQSGKVRPLKSNDVVVPKESLIARRVGLTHAH